MYLGIETSSAVSSVALLDENQILGEFTIQSGLTHSEQLVPHIEILLEQTRVDKDEIDGIVISIGPGSFTGLRIGLGTAKALAYGWQKPLISVMTMDGLAHNLINTTGIISVMIDGQKNNVYEARYRYKGAKLVCLQAPQVKARATAFTELKALGEPVIFLGDGAVMAADEIERYDSNFHLAPPHLQMPKASSLLIAALPIIEGGKFENPMDILPYYIRRSEAEVLWEKKHGVEPSQMEPTLTKIIEHADGSIFKEEGHA